MGRRIAIELLIVAAIGLLLAALGPFGSWVLPFDLRCLLWIGGIVAAYAIIRPMTAAGEWLAARVRAPALAGYLIVLSVAAVPITLLFGAVLRALPLQPAWNGSLALIYLQVWLIGFAIHLFMKRVLAPTTAAAPVPAPAEALREGHPAQPAPPPRLLARLPAHVGYRVLCLEMEDHYVRVHATGGSALLLMRLADAIAELDGVDGMQVHRSWWVARAAVTGIRRDNRSLRLDLENGMQVPVSRSYAALLRASGWADRAAA